MPDLPHGIEYYAALWDEACRHGHDPRAYLHDERRAASVIGTSSGNDSGSGSGQGAVDGATASKLPTA